MKKIASLAAAAALLAGTALAQPNAPVKIGVLTDLTSVFAAFDGPGSVEAGRLAVEDVGNVLGRPVELIAADHQNKPDVALTLARKWFDSDGVDAIFDVANSSIALAVNTLAGEKKKIVIFTAPTNDGMTEQACNGYGFAWVYDAYSLFRPSILYQAKNGGDTWFTLVPDYASGVIMENVVSEVLPAVGGKIVGSVRAPLGGADFSSYILQAQASKAKVIFVGQNGPDLINLLKQMREFGVAEKGQRIVLNGIHDTDIRAIGQDVLQDISVATPWYWDMDDQTRAFAKRFMPRVNTSPGWIHAGTYSAVLNYLKAVNAAGSKDSDKVREALFKLKIDDMFARNATLRPNGRLIHDFYQIRVKKPSESKYPWDYQQVVATIAANDAFRPLSDTKCPLVKK